MTALRTTRRGALALAGSAALAGCGDLFSRPPPTVDGTTLQSLTPAVPTIAAPLPVEVPESHYVDAQERATTLLDAVPSSFTDEQIPNEAVREEVAGVRDEAVAELEAAAGAEGPVARLDHLRAARGAAANAAAAWRSIDGDLVRATVLDRVDPIRSSMSDFRDEWASVGDEAVPAVLIHDRLEELVHQVERGITHDVEKNRRRPENAVTIGLLAGELERARAALEEAAAIYGAFEESVDGEVGETFETAAGALVQTLDDRLASLPEGNADDASSLVEADVSGTPTGAAIERLYWQLDDNDWIHAAIEADRPATAVMRAYRYLTGHAAFERLVERAEAGEAVRVTEAAQVLAFRESAIEAITGAATEAAWLPLAQAELHRVTGGLRRADAELRRNDDEAIEVDWIMDELRQYEMFGAIARSVPASSETVASALGDDERNA